MTADMSANELVLSRRTEVTEERLRTHWHWGDRFAHMNDEREDAYEQCYPALHMGTLAAQIDRAQTGARDPRSASGSRQVSSAASKRSEKRFSL